MAKQIDIRFLTRDFYLQYDSVNYPEIEHKEERPYAVLLVNVCGNKFAIPFRTNIRHKNAYKFRNSGRTTDSETGLDFTKAVIVNNGNFIGGSATIDRKEYVELSKNAVKIIKKFTTYVNNYIKYRKGIGAEYRRLDYQFTTLKYFERELNI